MNLIIRVINYIPRNFIDFFNILFFYFKSRKIKKLDQINKKTLLICTSGFLFQILQIWIIYIQSFFNKKLVSVLVKKENKKIIFLSKLFSLNIIFYENIIKKKIKLQKIKKKLVSIESEKNYLDFKYDNIEIGRIVLSTFFREKYSGKILIDNKVKKKLDEKLLFYISNYENLKNFIEVEKFKLFFSTEIYMQEYALLANIAIQKKIELIRFVPTVRDGSMLIFRVDKKNYRTHHSSINKEMFNYVKKNYKLNFLLKHIKKNFKERYSDKWHLSKRDHTVTNFNSKKQLKAKFLPNNENRRVGIIFSHILYDLIYAFGKDIYLNYYKWLSETIKLANKYKDVLWIIKFHPSNIWRGELNRQLKGKYEEERVIAETIKTLPDNIKVLDHTTKISPISLMKFADLCVTVRGTTALEMSILKKIVINAGTGRYDNFDFLHIAKNKRQYVSLLKKFNSNTLKPYITDKHKFVNACVFYYVIFCLKQFKMPILKVKKQLFKNKVLSNNDLNYFYDAKNRKNLVLFKDFLNNKDIKETYNDEKKLKNFSFINNLKI